MSSRASRKKISMSQRFWKSFMDQSLSKYPEFPYWREAGITECGCSESSCKETGGTLLRCNHAGCNFEIHPTCAMNNGQIAVLIHNNILICECPTHFKQPVFCHCQQPHSNSDGNMIFCETCCNWFHYSCIGIKLKDTFLIKEYQCKVCKSGAQISDDVKRKNMQNEALSISRLCGYHFLESIRYLEKTVWKELSAFEKNPSGSKCRKFKEFDVIEMINIINNPFKEIPSPYDEKLREFATAFDFSNITDEWLQVFRDLQMQVEAWKVTLNDKVEDILPRIESVLYNKEVPGFQGFALVEPMYSKFGFFSNVAYEKLESVFVFLGEISEQLGHLRVEPDEMDAYNSLYSALKWVDNIFETLHNQQEEKLTHLKVLSDLAKLTSQREKIKQIIEKGCSNGVFSKFNGIFTKITETASEMYSLFAIWVEKTNLLLAKDREKRRDGTLITLSELETHILRGKGFPFPIPMLQDLMRMQAKSVELNHQWSTISVKANHEDNDAEIAKIIVQWKAVPIASSFDTILEEIEDHIELRHKFNSILDWTKVTRKEDTMDERPKIENVMQILVEGYRILSDHIFGVTFSDLERNVASLSAGIEKTAIPILRDFRKKTFLHLSELENVILPVLHLEHQTGRGVVSFMLKSTQGCSRLVAWILIFIDSLNSSPSYRLIEDPEKLFRPLTTSVFKTMLEDAITFLMETDELCLPNLASDQESQESSANIPRIQTKNDLESYLSSVGLAIEKFPRRSDIQLNSVGLEYLCSLISIFKSIFVLYSEIGMGRRIWLEKRYEIAKSLLSSCSNAWTLVNEMIEKMRNKARVSEEEFESGIAAAKVLQVLDINIHKAANELLQQSYIFQEHFSKLCSEYAEQISVLRQNPIDLHGMNGNILSNVTVTLGNIVVQFGQLLEDSKSIPIPSALSTIMPIYKRVFVAYQHYSNMMVTYRSQIKTLQNTDIIETTPDPPLSLFDIGILNGELKSLLSKIILTIDYKKSEKLIWNEVSLSVPMTRIKELFEGDIEFLTRLYGSFLPISWNLDIFCVLFASPKRSLSDALTLKQKVDSSECASTIQSTGYYRVFSSKLKEARSFADTVDSYLNQYKLIVSNDKGLNSSVINYPFKMPETLSAIMTKSDYNYIILTGQQLLTDLSIDLLHDLEQAKQTNEGLIFPDCDALHSISEMMNCHKIIKQVVDFLLSLSTPEPQPMDVLDLFDPVIIYSLVKEIENLLRILDDFKYLQKIKDLFCGVLQKIKDWEDQNIESAPQESAKGKHSPLTRPLSKKRKTLEDLHSALQQQPLVELLGAKWKKAHELKKKVQELQDIKKEINSILLGAGREIKPATADCGDEIGNAGGSSDCKVILDIAEEMIKLRSLQERTRNTLEYLGNITFLELDALEWLMVSLETLNTLPSQVIAAVENNLRFEIKFIEAKVKSGNKLTSDEVEDLIEKISKSLSNINPSLQMTLKAIGVVKRDVSETESSTLFTSVELNKGVHRALVAIETALFTLQTWVIDADTFEAQLNAILKRIRSSEKNKSTLSARDCRALTDLSSVQQQMPMQIDKKILKKLEVAISKIPKDFSYISATTSFQEESQRKASPSSDTSSSSSSTSSDPEPDDGDYDEDGSVSSEENVQENSDAHVEGADMKDRSSVKGDQRYKRKVHSEVGNNSDMPVIKKKRRVETLETSSISSYQRRETNVSDAHKSSKGYKGAKTVSTRLCVRCKTPILPSKLRMSNFFCKESCLISSLPNIVRVFGFYRECLQKPDLAVETWSAKAADLCALQRVSELQPDRPDTELQPQICIKNTDFIDDSNGSLDTSDPHDPSESFAENGTSSLITNENNKSQDSGGVSVKESVQEVTNLQNETNEVDLQRDERALSSTNSLELSTVDSNGFYCPEILPHIPSVSVKILSLAQTSNTSSDEMKPLVRSLLKSRSQEKDDIPDVDRSSVLRTSVRQSLEEVFFSCFTRACANQNPLVKLPLAQSGMLAMDMEEELFSKYIKLDKSSWKAEYRKHTRTLKSNLKKEHNDVLILDLLKGDKLDKSIQRLLSMEITQFAASEEQERRAEQLRNAIQNSLTTRSLEETFEARRRLTMSGEGDLWRSKADSTSLDNATKTILEQVNSDVSSLDLGEPSSTSGPDEITEAQGSGSSLSKISKFKEMSNSESSSLKRSIDVDAGERFASFSSSGPTTSFKRAKPISYKTDPRNVHLDEVSETEDMKVVPDPTKTTPKILDLNKLLEKPIKAAPEVAVIPAGTTIFLSATPEGTYTPAIYTQAPPYQAIPAAAAHQTVTSAPAFQPPSAPPAFQPPPPPSQDRPPPPNLSKVPIYMVNSEGGTEFHIEHDTSEFRAACTIVTLDRRVHGLVPKQIPNFYGGALEGKDNVPGFINYKLEKRATVIAPFVISFNNTEDNLPNFKEFCEFFPSKKKVGLSVLKKGDKDGYDAQVYVFPTSLKSRFSCLDNWNLPDQITRRPIGSASPPAILLGFVYAPCQGPLHLVDGPDRPFPIYRAPVASTSSGGQTPPVARMPIPASLPSAEPAASRPVQRTGNSNNKSVVANVVGKMEDDSSRISQPLLQSQPRPEGQLAKPLVSQPSTDSTKIPRPSNDIPQDSFFRPPLMRASSDPIPQPARFSPPRGYDRGGPRENDWRDSDRPYDDFKDRDNLRQRNHNAAFNDRALDRPYDRSRSSESHHSPPHRSRSRSPQRNRGNYDSRSRSPPRRDTGPRFPDRRFDSSNTRNPQRESDSRDRPYHSWDGPYTNDKLSSTSLRGGHPDTRNHHSDYQDMQGRPSTRQSQEREYSSTNHNQNRIQSEMTTRNGRAPAVTSSAPSPASVEVPSRAVPVSQQSSSSSSSVTSGREGLVEIMRKTADFCIKIEITNPHILEDLRKKSGSDSTLPFIFPSSPNFVEFMDIMKELRSQNQIETVADESKREGDSRDDSNSGTRTNSGRGRSRLLPRKQRNSESSSHRDEYHEDE